MNKIIENSSKLINLTDDIKNQYLEFLDTKKQFDEEETGKRIYDIKGILNY
jgi:hypothetical protein